MNFGLGRPDATQLPVHPLGRPSPDPVALHRPACASSLLGEILPSDPKFCRDTSPLTLLTLRRCSNRGHFPSLLLEILGDHYYLWSWDLKPGADRVRGQRAILPRRQLPRRAHAS